MKCSSGGLRARRRSTSIMTIMRVLYCGTGDIGIPALRVLAGSAGHELAGVITQPDRPAGRDMKPRASAIKAEALVRGLPVFQPERIRPGESALTALGLDVMVVMAYGQILPGSLLNIPRLGCLNLHASLLPRHRGASPIQAAIASGDSESGITVIYMDEGLDTGDILLSDPLAIGPAETAGELHDRLAVLAAGSIVRALDLLATGAAPRVPQNDSAATYAAKLTKADGWIDWTLPCDRIERRVRAMSPWPGAFARVAGSSAILKIHKARISPASGPPGTVLSGGSYGILVAAGGGSLVLEEVQLEGRRRLSAPEFLRGFPIPSGSLFDLSFSVSP